MSRSASSDFLAVEVTIDGGTTHARFGCEVFHRDRAKSPFGEQSRGGANELLTPFGLHPTALGDFIHLAELPLDVSAISLVHYFS